jgi:predicted TIM-barrel fold metal-dependent hydrolase
MLWSDGIEEIINRHGVERVLFGSAEPRNRYSVNFRTLERLELSPAAQEAVYHGNAARIFRC